MNTQPHPITPNRSTAPRSGPAEVSTPSAGNPSAADIAAAERFVDEEYGPTCDASYIAPWRAKLVRQMAVAEMQKRQHAERLRRRAAETSQVAA